jgi:hypothetical protein
MSTCAECKHWDRTPEEFFDVPGLRSCHATPQLWDATEWDVDAERVVKTKYKDALAFVQDGSDYHATLYTMPTFFCAMFAAKEQP